MRSADTIFRKISGLVVLAIYLVCNVVDTQQNTPSTGPVSTADGALQNLLVLRQILGSGSSGSPFGLGPVSLGDSLGLGMDSLGSGGLMTTLPVVGDFHRFNKQLEGKCLLVGARCEIKNAVCTAVVPTILSVGVCRCKFGFSAANGICV